MLINLSDEQFETIVGALSGHCPDDLNLEENCGLPCFDCWKEALKSLEVKSGWVSVEDRLPESGDYNVIARFPNGSIEMVHAQDYFDDITSGIVDGVQTYTKMYLSVGITHWRKMPEWPREGE